MKLDHHCSQLCQQKAFTICHQQTPQTRRCFLATNYRKHYTIFELIYILHTNFKDYLLSYYRIKYPLSSAATLLHEAGAFIVRVIVYILSIKPVLCIDKTVF